MKTDPDFHPLAAAWLDGTAHDGERALLRELLASHPDHMETWAALCHTESLLHLHGKSGRAVERLDRLVFPPSWCRVLRSPWLLRGAAAVAAVGLLLWAFWPETSVTGDAAVRAPGVSRGSPRPLSRPGGDAEPRQEDFLPPGKWPGHLHRTCIRDISLEGSLAEALSTLSKRIPALEGTAVALHADGEPDAPVHVIPRTSLTAWTLLRVIACQTGMTLEATDEGVRLTASTAPHSRSAPGRASLTLTELRTLFAVRSSSDKSDETGDFSRRARDAFGMDVTFPPASEISASVNGSARDAAVLLAARDGIVNSPHRVLLVVQSGTGVRQNVPEPAADSSPLSGVFGEPQFRALTEAAAAVPGSQFGEPVSKLVLPGEEATASSHGSRNAMPKKLGNVDLSVVAEPFDNGISLSIEAEFPRPGTPPGSSIRTGVVIWPGQTVGLTAPGMAAGFEGWIWITAVSLEKALLDSTTAGASAPSAIPIAGRPGWALSPWAPAAPPMDISARQTGDRLSCPATGKPVKVP